MSATTCGNGTTPNQGNRDNTRNAGAPRAAMSATQILDAIAWKHSSCALIREVEVLDNDALDLASALSAAWWERHRAKGYAHDPTDPSPATPVSRRIDGLMLDGGSTRTAIEVKVSRSDFLRETEEKRRPWRRITHRFVYATPTGLLKPGEIPDGCGLWEINVDGAVTIAKRARANKHPDPIPQQVLVTLAYRLKTLQRATNPARPGTEPASPAAEQDAATTTSTQPVGER